MEENEKNNKDFMTRLAEFIVDKRNLFFLATVIGVIFSFFSTNWVSLENDLATFLPATSSTRQGLDLMEEQFTTFIPWTISTGFGKPQIS